MFVFLHTARDNSSTEIRFLALFHSTLLFIAFNTDCKLAYFSVALEIPFS